eukprot:TRINITY_DN9539_c0_g1_i3.p1 TRINITY_DN9539_c0_g1~~TRINITY_DN9539_c0_g1_i3.p1  ORF type:complete len:239 (+),score=27.09 TRINITY_DN9539_c0_g1_i3:759-1475(+)
MVSICWRLSRNLYPCIKNNCTTVHLMGSYARSNAYCTRPLSLCADNSCADNSMFMLKIDCRHFQATGHFKARNVTTGRVWNYITDDYDQDDGVRPPTETKETSLMLEYTHSLTLELDAQRVRFEKQLIEVRKRLDAQQREMRADLERLQQSYRELSEQLLSASKQQKESHASVLQARTRLRKTVEQVAEEQAFVDALKAKPPPASETMKSKPNPKLARLEKQLSKLMAKRSALYAALA